MRTKGSLRFFMMALLFQISGAVLPQIAFAKFQCVPGKFFDLAGKRHQLCYQSQVSRSQMSESEFKKTGSRAYVCSQVSGQSRCSPWSRSLAEKALGKSDPQALNLPFQAAFGSNGSRLQPAPAQQKPSPTPGQGPVDQAQGSEKAKTGTADCEIPQGPVAYNIQSSTGQGEKCNARSVVVGYKGSFSRVQSKGQFAMGYINPLVETNELGKYRADQKKCFRNTDGSRYCEGKFNDYGSAKAVKYLTDQIEHWKDEGEKINQSCVPVDIDNCDGIGTANYQKVMDLVAKLNRQRPKTKIKVFVKNAHMAECKQFLNHSEAVGAFIEEISASDVSKLVSYRKDPNQMLIFAQGSERGSEHASLSSINGRAIPNSSISFGDGDYAGVNKCTHHPSAGRSDSPRTQAPRVTAARR